MKLKAAQFLIANMEGKYSEYYNTPWQNIASALYRWNDIPDEERLLVKHDWGELKVEEDVKFITSEYLINNIELAFKVWMEQPWGKNISFDVFVRKYCLIELEKSLWKIGVKNTDRFCRYEQLLQGASGHNRS